MLRAWLGQECQLGQQQPSRALPGPKRALPGIRCPAWHGTLRGARHLSLDRSKLSARVKVAWWHRPVGTAARSTRAAQLPLPLWREAAVAASSSLLRGGSSWASDPGSWHLVLGSFRYPRLQLRAGTGGGGVVAASSRGRASLGVLVLPSEPVGHRWSF